MRYVLGRGDAFLCTQLGISTRPHENHVGYVVHWLEVIR